MQGKCAFCDREGTLTRHHLNPRTRHHNKWNQRELARETARAVVGLCGSCHPQIHQLLTEKQLEREFNTLEQLRAQPGITAFVDWIRTKPDGFRAVMRPSSALQRTVRRA